jgi:hypothetical protein
MTKTISFGIVAVAGLGAIIWGWSFGSSRTQLSASQQSFDLAEGQLLYQQFCASCHGIDLEGQPDWQSPGADNIFPTPSHNETGHTWHHSDAALFTQPSEGGDPSVPKCLDQIGAEVQARTTFLLVA